MAVAFTWQVRARRPPHGSVVPPLSLLLWCNISLLAMQNASTPRILFLFRGGREVHGVHADDCEAAHLLGCAGAALLERHREAPCAQHHRGASSACCFLCMMHSLLVPPTTSGPACPQELPLAGGKEQAGWQHVAIGTYRNSCPCRGWSFSRSSRERHLPSCPSPAIFGT